MTRVILLALREFVIRFGGVIEGVLIGLFAGLAAIVLWSSLTRPAAATEITALSSRGAPQLSTDSILGRDLIDAAWNADQAVAIGALPADDPLPLCLHSVLQETGLETGSAGDLPAERSFAPRLSGVVSGGVVLYLKIQQAKAIASGATRLQLSNECLALVGRTMVDGLRDRRALTRGVILPLGLRALGL